MNIPQDQIEELKSIAPSLQMASEGGYTYILISQLNLPGNCKPSVVDALLCPMPKDGYQSRLYFDTTLNGGPQRNWNANVRILGKTWYGISWQTPIGLTLKEMLLVHIKAFRI
jgi:hypothetical protein